MKQSKQVQKNLKNSEKKKYQKPKVVHSSSIETLAGSCAAISGCTPNYTS